MIDPGRRVETGTQLHPRFDSEGGLDAVGYSSCFAFSALTSFSTRSRRSRIMSSLAPMSRGPSVGAGASRAASTAGGYELFTMAFVAASSDRLTSGGNSSPCFLSASSNMPNEKPLLIERPAGRAAIQLRLKLLAQPVNFDGHLDLAGPGRSGRFLGTT